MPRSEDDISGFVPAPNVVQLTAMYVNNGEIAENVFHYSSGAAPDAGTMNNLIDAYIAWETAHGANFRNTNTQLQRIIATDLTTDSGTLVDRAVTPGVNGTVATAACPGNVTLAVAKRTALRGRSFRGRIFHIGMAVSMTSGDQLLVAQLAPLIASYTLLLSLGVAPIFHLGVLSHRHNNVALNPRVFTQATAITADDNLDSQRRRLFGR